MRAATILPSLLASVVLWGTAPTLARPLDVLDRFIPSGWMGDGVYGRRYMDLNERWNDAVGGRRAVVRVSWVPGPAQWTGIYWLNLENNWGRRPGLDLSDRGYRCITFFARGERGGERIRFIAGGIRKRGEPYRDSFRVRGPKQRLGRKWKKYVLSLRGKNLRSVIGVFGWVTSARWNRGRPLVFYIDDVRYETDRKACRRK